MRAIFFSDLHVHAFRDFAHTVKKTGRNSRLENTLKVLRRIRKYAVKNRIHLVFFGGDLFHKKEVMRIGTYQPVYEELEKFRQADIEFFGIVGNHDQATIDGKTHATKALSGGSVRFIDEPKLIEPHANFPRIWCVPYIEDHKEFKHAIFRGSSSKCTILLAHGGINGAVTGPVEYQPKEPLEPDDIPSDYVFSFFGHYHRRQKIADRVWYIGSPLQMARGERKEGDKGFLVYDSTTNKFTNVPLGFPEFVQIKIDKPLLTKEQEAAVKGNYVDVEFHTNEMDASTAISVVHAAGADTVTAVPLRPPERELEKRLDVDLGMDFGDVVEKYVRKYADADDVEDVLKEAKEALEAVS